jgi:hypothetical protein
MVAASYFSLISRDETTVSDGRSVSSPETSARTTIQSSATVKHPA